MPAALLFVIFVVLLVIAIPEIQTLIGEYGVKEYGEPLFFPNAEQK